MAIPISPGVYTKIIDLSTYVQAIPGTIGFVVILSKKGRDNELIFVSSQDDFASEFGRPNITEFGKQFGQGPYICMNFLAVCSSLYVIRALPDDAWYSNLFLVTSEDSTASVEVKNFSSQNSVAELETTLRTQFTEGSALMTPVVYFRAIGRGDYYDGIGIRLTPHVNPLVVDIVVLDVYEIMSDGDEVIVETFEVSFDDTLLDESGESVYIEDVLNKYSKYLRCNVNFAGIKIVEDRGLDITHPFGSPNSIHLDGGSDGSLLNIDSTTGKVVVNSTTAIQVLTQAYAGLIINPVTSLAEDNVYDLDNIYFTLVWDPGYPSDVKTQISYLAYGQRRDCVAILDNGDNPTANLALTARLNDQDFNNFYTALYEPYTKVYDMYTGRDIWVSPVYHMSSMIPLNDELYEIWYPSAGFNRGTIDKIKDMRYNCKLGDRDRFYLSQLNPIVKFNVGYTVWGQLTSQKRPSKLQDLHAVRTVLYIKRALEQYCKFFIFEFNDEQTWSQIRADITPFLEYVKRARGLSSYEVEVGATEYELKAKICHVDVVLEPTPIIEKIMLNLYIK
jgi:hypothetical protein